MLNKILEILSYIFPFIIKCKNDDNTDQASGNIKTNATILSSNGNINNFTANTINYNNSENSSNGVSAVSNQKRIYTKSNTSILFIDDKNFGVVNLLKKTGWTETKRLKDVLDMNCKDLRDADVVFIDIQGVGTKLFPKEEGFGICREVRKKYKNKFIVIYSAEANHFNENIQYANKILDKNTNPQAFLNLLDNFIEEQNEDTNKR